MVQLCYNINDLRIILNLLNIRIQAYRLNRKTSPHVYFHYNSVKKKLLRILFLGKQYNFNDEIKWRRRIDKKEANERIINIK